MSAFLGSKICNCVFVVVRQFPEGHQYTYVDNFAKETSTDSLYFREAFKLLIARKELFKDVTKIWIAGDNGNTTLARAHACTYTATQAHTSEATKPCIGQSTLWDMTKNIYGYCSRSTECTYLCTVAQLRNRVRGCVTDLLSRILPLRYARSCMQAQSVHSQNQWPCSNRSR